MRSEDGQTPHRRRSILELVHDDFEACWRAAASRDRRFDGRFFIGVHSTRIYCRPICPAPPAKRENVRFYPTAAAAAAAGLRACRRCRPEAAPGTPEWFGGSATVARGLRLIACDSGPMHLAAACGLAVVALEGPQEAARTGPWPLGEGRHRVVISAHPPACAPCRKRRCRHPSGPVCMAEIDAEDVVGALES